MSYDISDRLQQISHQLTEVSAHLDAAPVKADTADLMAALKVIEDYYKDDFCHNCDIDFGESPGTTYKTGISLEFYIEADWWHNVSLALRKLNEDLAHKAMLENTDSP